MIETKHEIAINQNFWDKKYQVAIFSNHGGKCYVSKPVEMTERAENDSVVPMAEFTEDELQAFFNRLWHFGFRPKDGTGNSGHVEALKYHLEDMRKLVFSDGNKDLK